MYMKLHSLCALLKYAVMLLPLSVGAEVVTDGSLGSTVTLAGPNYAIMSDLGRQQGANLFHSFQSFNLNASESAVFSGPATVQNIVSRVTGGQPSFIDGKLGSDISGANLYFLNPTGIVFGANATLDLRGSFHASTADALHFSDGQKFQATHPEQSQFSSAAPSAFGFFDSSPAALKVESGVLAVADGKTLSLVGGDLSLDAGGLTAKGGRLNLASVKTAGEVRVQEQGLEMTSTGGILRLDQASLNVAASAKAPSGGALYAQAGQLEINNSRLASSTVQGVGQPISLQADTIKISNGNLITTSTFSSGQGGDIRMTATQSIEFSGTAPADSFIGNADLGNTINANAGTSGFKVSGNSGSIQIQAPKILIQDGTQISSTSFTTGNGGEIRIAASDSLSLSGEDKKGNTSALLTGAVSSGKAGRIQVQAGHFALLNGAKISAETQGSGRGGDVQIQADSIKLAGLDSGGFGSFIAANASGTAPNAGAGGSVSLEAKTITFNDGAQVANATFGPAAGGEIVLKASDSAVFSGKDAQGFLSGLNSAVQTDASGTGGNIQVTAGHVQVLDGAELTVGTFGSGKGGSLTLDAERVTLDKGGYITGLSDGFGDAGDINMNLRGVLSLSNQAAISTAANGANGGSVTINSSQYIYAQNSSITTSVIDTATGRSGNGGNIWLNPEFIVQKNTPIIARAERGNGGDILINTTGIYKFPPAGANPIDASSKFGVDGVVEINSPDVNVAEAVLAVSTDFLDSDIVLQTSCAKNEEPSSRFVLKERQGVPNRQGDWAPSNIIFE